MSDSAAIFRNQKPRFGDNTSGCIGRTMMRGDMTWTETFNCDICGKQKGSVDHWWLAWTEAFSPHRDAAERPMLKVYPWENMLAHDANAKHLCGQACLQKLVDRWMNTEMGTAHGAAAAGRDNVREIKK